MLFKPQIEGLPTIHRTLGEDGGVMVDGGL